MLEYIIIIAVVLAAILVFANGGLGAAVGKIFGNTSNAMNSAAANIKIQ